MQILTNNSGKIKSRQDFSIKNEKSRAEKVAGMKFNGSTIGRKAKKKCFTKRLLTVALDHLISNSYFIVSNVVMRQKIAIPMGIDPLHFGQAFFIQGV